MPSLRWCITSLQGYGAEWTAVRDLTFFPRWVNKSIFFPPTLLYLLSANAMYKYSTVLYTIHRNILIMYQHIHIRCHFTHHLLKKYSSKFRSNAHTCCDDEVSPAVTPTKKNISERIMKHPDRGNSQCSVKTARYERDIAQWTIQIV